MFVIRLKLTKRAVVRRNAACIALFAVPALWTAVPTPVSGQDTLFVNADEAECEGCRLVFGQILTLGDRSGDGIIPGNPRGAARDRDGNFWINFHFGADVPSVFNSAGEFVRLIGRKGGGPGEFGNAGLTLIGNSSTDSVFAFDAANLRLSVYHTATDQPVRSTPVRGLWGEAFLVLDDGTLIFNAVSSMPAFAGAPLHVFDAGGNHVRSFGGEGNPRLTRNTRAQSRRKLSRSSVPGQFWSLSPGGVLERWDTTGTRLQTIVRRADWFNPVGEYLGASPDREPHPELAFLHQDGDGLLWIGVMVGDPNWAASLVPEKKGRRAEYRVVNENAYGDIQIEVIDPENGTLIVSKRLDPLAGIAIGSTYLISKSDDFEDDPKLHVWQMRLINPNR